ncbi:MAG: hybrid sensor histidine kinase/response regulator, partial [Mesorhizobium sp.]
ERYPEIKIVHVGNESQLLASITNGDADAAIGILVMTDYQIYTNFQDKLKVVSIVGDSPAWISFGVGLASPELQSILDKVLLSISPIEMENLANRWRPNELVVVDSFW